jgi:serine/threonine protein kinase
MDTARIDFDVMRDQKCVVKYYNFQSAELRKEIKILTMIKHPNLMSLINVIDNDESPEIGIISHREDSDLMEYLKYHGTRLSYHAKMNIAIQLASGLSVLHAHNILHADLKLENILITGRNIKITDFGSSEFLDPKTGVIKTKQIKCTATHRPPEGFISYIYLMDFEENNFILTAKFDVWSYGVIMYELWSGCPIYRQKIIPSFTKNMDERIYDESIFNTILTTKHYENILKYLPKKFSGCFQINPNIRPSSSNILKSLYNI